MKLAFVSLMVACGLACSATAQVRITEYMYSGNGPEFFEITNTGSQSVDLAGWSYDDNNRNPGAFDLSSVGTLNPGESAVITEGVVAEFKTAWLLSTVIKVVGGVGNPTGNNLGRSDEINIYNNNSELMDRLTFGDEVFAGSIRTRNTSGWCTAEAAGQNSILGWQLSALGDIQGTWTSSQGDKGSPGVHASGNVAARTPTPVFSVPAGFYNDPFSLLIMPQAGSATIHYTLDGSDPTESSPIYTGPITVDTRLNDPDQYAIIQTCAPELWAPPRRTSFKSNVIRAMAVRAGYSPSHIVTKTYFVGPNVATRYSMPVVSVVTDPVNLFGYDTGIYVPGRIYDEENVPGTHWGLRSANFTQEGAAWERSGHIEFFETGGSLAFAQNIALRIHGGYSTQFKQKSLRVYADSGINHSTEFNYPIFQDQAPAVHRRIILRNQGQDNFWSFCRDDLVARLIPSSLTDSMASRFAVVFVDGEFWGVHGVRERFDKYYIENNYGYNPENLDILEGTGLTEASVSEGDHLHYLSMIEFMRANSPAVPENMEEVERRMDVDQYLTYLAVETWTCNMDWPTGNVRMWRPRTPDGRWRWNLYDVDQSMAWGASSHPGCNPFGRLFNDTSFSTELFRMIMQNQSVRKRFVNRLADLMNWYLTTDRTREELERIRLELLPEMPLHIDRWGYPVLLSIWQQEMAELDSFLQNRNANLPQHVLSHFQLPGTWNLSVEVPDGVLGAIQLNSLDLTGAAFPWSGTYYQTVPVTISTQPPQGYCAVISVGEQVHIGQLTLDPSVDQQVMITYTLSPDLNQDGGIDGDDVSAFFVAWENSWIEGDFNNDGGIDGSDIASFFTLWERGGC